MHSTTPRYSTHPTVVAGVMLIASLHLFAVLFWVVIGLSMLFNPIETRYYGSLVIEPSFSDYLSGVRITIAATVAAITTALFWFMTAD